MERSIPGTFYTFSRNSSALHSFARLNRLHFCILLVYSRILVRTREGVKAKRFSELMPPNRHYKLFICLLKCSSSALVPAVSFQRNLILFIWTSAERRLNDGFLEISCGYLLNIVAIRYIAFQKPFVKR